MPVQNPVVLWTRQPDNLQLVSHFWGADSAPKKPPVSFFDPIFFLSVAHGMDRPTFRGNKRIVCHCSLLLIASQRPFPIPHHPMGNEARNTWPETIRLQRTSEAQTAAIEPHDEWGRISWAPKKCEIENWGTWKYISKTWDLESWLRIQHWFSGNINIPQDPVMNHHFAG